MFVRTESRVLAAVAFVLLLAAGAGTLNWLFAAGPFPAESADGRDSRPSPHLFQGELELSSQIQSHLSTLPSSASSPTGLQPTEVQPLADPTYLSPRAPQSQPTESLPTPALSQSSHQLPESLALTNPFLAERPHFFPGAPRVASSQHSGSPIDQAPLATLPQKQSPVPQQPAGLAAAERPKVDPPKPQLANLPAAASTSTALQPAAVSPAAQPHFFKSLHRLASLPTTEPASSKPAQPNRPAPPPLKPVQPAEALAVQTASFSHSEPQLPELPTRFPGPSITLQSTEVQPASPGKYVAGEMHLVSLPQRFPAPAVQLNPAEVSPLQSSFDPMIIAETRLVTLQPRSTNPATPLQPAEVLPIPAPDSPATPFAPMIDQDRPIAALTTNIAPPSGKLPADVALEKFRGEFPAWLPRPWGEVTYFWDAPDLCYGPLRYEEVNVERYGYSHCPMVQPALSAAHFFCATLALPYNMTVHPHKECIYPLGHYRPGSPVPFRHIRPEPSLAASSVEVGTIAGLILLIP